MHNVNAHAMEIVLPVFDTDPIDDELAPVAALAIIECTPALRGASIAEMILVHQELCIAILARDLSKSLVN